MLRRIAQKKREAIIRNVAYGLGVVAFIVTVLFGCYLALWGFVWSLYWFSHWQWPVFG